MAVKVAVDILAGPICHMINMSLGTTIFMVKWKLVQIIPLKKSKYGVPHE